LTLQSILTEMYEPLKRAKSPKILSDAIQWTHQALLDFGIGGVRVREYVDFLKNALSNTNQTVRNNAILSLGVLRVYVGPGNYSLIVLNYGF
jgi:cytoskeleton-associated protein 5